MKLNKRFWDKVTKTASGCWIWTSAMTKTGYGLFWCEGRPKRAHRLSYQSAFGSIRVGNEIDHLCRNRACVNPEHLQSVSHRINVLRGEGLCAKNARKEKCLRGHDFTHTLSDGERVCGKCNTIRSRIFRSKRIIDTSPKVVQ